MTVTAMGTDQRGHQLNTMSATSNDDISFNPVDEASAVDSTNVIIAMIDAVAIGDAETTHSVDVTPIEIEKLKVQALSRQMSRSQDENRQLQSLLKQAQADLERQIQQTHKYLALHLCTRDAIEQPVSVPCNEVQKLRAELTSTHKDLADEIETTYKRDARILLLQGQVDSLKQQLEQKEIRDEKQSDIFIKNLKKQRSELLVVIKKQTKLIDILKQQRAHAEAALLLDVAEKDFMKVVNGRQ
jgi:hypothetical protein